MDPDSLRNKYTGSRAKDYENKRAEYPKWRREQRAVADQLRQLTADQDVDAVLDIPVGTGRFFEIYEELGLDVVGIDVSADMLEEARKNAIGHEGVELEQGDIFELDCHEFRPDVVVCFRFANWIDFDDLTRAVENLSQTGTKYIILRNRTPPHSRGRKTPVDRIGAAGNGVTHLVRRAVSILRTEGPVELGRAIQSRVRTEIDRKRSPRGSPLTSHDESELRRMLGEFGFEMDQKRLIDASNTRDVYSYVFARSDQ